MPSAQARRLTLAMFRFNATAVLAALAPRCTRSLSKVVSSSVHGFTMGFIKWLIINPMIETLHCRFGSPFGVGLHVLSVCVNFPAIQSCRRLLGRNKLTPLVGWPSERAKVSLDRAWDEELGCVCGAGDPCICNQTDGIDEPDVSQLITDPRFPRKTN